MDLSNPESNQLWVFGYGSLCWNPGFKYRESVTGYIRGYSRRFWQGNTTHRGTPNKPGRVATLVEDKDGIVWGRAFLVGDSCALPYLDQRECKLGGYTISRSPFTPQDSELAGLEVLFYLATPLNNLWLGEAPETDIASQILTSSGPSGHNVEYLLRLAEFMREHIPGEEDDHLFYLEELVLAGCEEMNLCLSTIMGVPRTLRNHRSPGFLPRVPPRKLRCLSV